MTKGRSTTYEERIALVKECIENGYNYREIAEKYKVGYQQIYTWVKKYKEKWPQDYPSNMGLYYRDKYWFRDYLRTKGIPYDDIILDEVCGVNYEKQLNKRMFEAGKERRGWF